MKNRNSINDLPNSFDRTIMNQSIKNAAIRKAYVTNAQFTVVSHDMQWEWLPDEKETRKETNKPKFDRTPSV